MKMTQPELKAFMTKFLRRNYKRVVATKDYVYSIGDIPICLVAHMDTVFTKSPEFFLYDEQQEILWSPHGLGADDRAGVYAIMHLINRGYRPHIILTTDEEKGCIGAMHLSKIKCPFKDVRYFIQLDRRGIKDCVFYNCANEDFVTYVEKFGFEEAYGTFTDITEFCPEWGVAGVNLSVGYINEHSTQEMLFLKVLRSTIKKVEKMLSEKEIPKFKYVDLYQYPYGYDYVDLYSKEWKGLSNKKCSFCQGYFLEEDLFEAEIAGTDKQAHLCPDCICKHGNWCNKCGQLYVGKNHTCKEKLTDNAGPNQKNLKL